MRFKPDSFINNFLNMFSKSKPPRVALTMLYHGVIIERGYTEVLREGDGVCVIEDKDGKLKLKDCMYRANAVVTSLWGRVSEADNHTHIKDAQISVSLLHDKSLHLIDLP